MPRRVIVLAAALACLLPSSAIVAAAPATQGSTRPATAPFSFHSESPGIEVRMSLVPANASKQFDFQASVLLLSGTRPAEVKQVPSGVAPRYAQIKFGEKTWYGNLSAPPGQAMKFYFDANGNGDLTDDPPRAMKRVPAKGLSPAHNECSVQVPLSSDANSALVSLVVFTPTPRAGAPSLLALFAVPDYFYEGAITLGGETYKARLFENVPKGDFAAIPDRENESAALAIDINQSGAFGTRGETFPVAKPFNIKGATYEISDLKPGGAFRIVKSERSAPEIAIYEPGHKVLPFTATTMDGKTVHFPDDYKGKIVLLNFWATWCAPCMAEMPQITRTYADLHAKGFEVLGVSRDKPNAADKVKAAIAAHGMKWPQIFGDSPDADDIARRYGVDSIPACWLVDGDSGEILVPEELLLGDRLEPTVRAAVLKKATSPK